MFNLLKKFILYLLSFNFIIGFAGPVFAKDKHMDAKINCDIQQTACTQSVSGGRITFDIIEKPVKAMTDITFEVRITDIEITGPPLIDLSMPGMKMGKNQVEMKMIQTNVYQGTGVIVRCPSGKTVWQATVDLPGKESAAFIFDVIY